MIAHLFTHSLTRPLCWLQVCTRAAITRLVAAILLLCPTLLTLAAPSGSKVLPLVVVPLVWKARNVRVRLAITPNDLLSELALEQAVRKRLGIADQTNGCLAAHSLCDVIVRTAAESGWRTVRDDQ